MEIQGSISFGARPCGKAKIEVLNKTVEKYYSKSVNFVKLEPHNKNDIIAVDEACETWEDAKYIKSITTASHFMSFNDIDVFALTAQRNNFHELDARSILGFAEIRKDNIDKNCAFLNHLQVKPSAINVNQYNEVTHKHVGSSMLASLKRIYKSISLTPVDSPNIIKFYENNGFVEDRRYAGRYVWHSNIIDKLKLSFNNYLKSLIGF